MNERVGRVVAAHVRVHRNGLSPRPQRANIERDPPLDGAERELVEGVARHTRDARFG
jgi:hypothetical protein